MAEGLDHSLMLPNHTVYNKTEALAFNGSERDLVDGGPLAGAANPIAQANLGDKLAMDVGEMIIMCVLDVESRELDTFFDNGHGKDIIGFADRDQEPLNDGEGQRQLHTDAGALAKLAGDRELTTQGLHCLFHDVHSDTTA